MKNKNNDTYKIYILFFEHLTDLNISLLAVMVSNFYSSSLESYHLSPDLIVAEICISVNKLGEAPRDLQLAHLNVIDTPCLDLRPSDLFSCIKYQSILLGFGSRSRKYYYVFRSLFFSTSKPIG